MNENFCITYSIGTTPYKLEFANEEEKELGMNDIGRITLRTSQPVFWDSYRRNRNTGSFILVDPFTSETLAAGMLR